MSIIVSRLIQQRIEKTKERLENVDESIRKLTGRDAGEWREMGDQRRVSIGDRGGGGGGGFDIGGRLGQRGIAGRLGPRRGGRGRGQSGLGSVGRMETFQRLGMPLRRQSTGSAFSRLGSRVDARDRGRDESDNEEEEEEDDEDDDDIKKPALQSSVVATSPVVKSREDTVRDQQKDKRGQARNKRMFGLLLGTLYKFKQEATHSDDKNLKRAEIEQKLDQKAKEEKQALVTERKELFNERREKQLEMEKLEDLMILANEQEEWDKHATSLSRFICTKAKPNIFYMPKVQTAQTKKKLQESQDGLMRNVKQRKDDLNKQLEELEHERTRRRERVEQREREEKENLKAREQIQSYVGHHQRRVIEGRDERRVSETRREKPRKSEDEERARHHHKRRRTRSRSDDPHKRERSERKADVVGKEEPASKKLKEVEEEEEEETKAEATAAVTTTSEGMESSSGKPGKYDEGEMHDGEGQSSIAQEGPPGTGDAGQEESAVGDGSELLPDLSSIQLPEGPGVPIPPKQIKKEDTPVVPAPDANPSNDFQTGGLDEQLDYNEAME